jgi:hypothetical protein
MCEEPAQRFERFHRNGERAMPGHVAAYFGGIATVVAAMGVGFGSAVMLVDTQPAPKEPPRALTKQHEPVAAAADMERQTAPVASSAAAPRAQSAVQGLASVPASPAPAPAPQPAQGPEHSAAMAYAPQPQPPSAPKPPKESRKPFVAAPAPTTAARDPGTVQSEFRRKHEQKKLQDPKAVAQRKAKKPYIVEQWVEREEVQEQPVERTPRQAELFGLISDH